ncbi:LPS export ABC transporter permease LptG [Cochlodiniinecator piscidefendens]|uniref:LPS export ABC transporter permease LptG n=1 Tax=Cochlodiniinecator piscidefendens TaxID=2715756 RepID=UPI00140D5F11|nr:LPS export ABC transporter permease LptG [Cochlodiniinecator piscidefendens]
MKLHVYFARKFAMALMLVGGVLSGILVLIEMVEQSRRYGQHGAGFSDVLTLSVLKVPETLYEMLPLIVILATLTLFLGLARSSEMVVTRAAGRSALRALIAPCIVAALFGAVAVAAFNPIVAATSKEYENRANAFVTGRSSSFSVSSEGLWLRQGDASGQTVIYADHANLDGTVLWQTSFLTFSPDGVALRRLTANRAELQDGGWKLSNVKIWPLTGSDNPERDAGTHEELILPSSLTPEQIRDSFGTPNSIPIWELPAFISRLENAGFSARQHKVWFQLELALPLLFIAMVLVGATFTLRHTRFGRTGVMVLAAILMGFALFFIRNFAQVLAESGQIPAILAAWAPPIAAIFLSLAALLHLEDG